MSVNEIRRKSSDAYGYKNAAAQYKLMQSVPTDSDFNPYDYIDQANYKLNRRGKAQYQEDLAKLLYMAQINQEERMNEYNSPLSQAQRMREAGLNPDVTGVDNVAASNVAGYSGNPMDSVSSNLDVFGDSLGIISGVANIATGMITSVQQISSNSVKNLLSGLDASGAISDFFASGPSSESAKDFVKSIPGLSRSQQKRVLKSFRSTFGSTANETAYNNFIAAWNDSRGNYNRSRHNPFNEPIEQLSPAQYVEVWQPYIDSLQAEAIKTLNDTDSSGYERDIKKYQKESLDTYKRPLMEVFNKLDTLGDVGLYLKAALSAFILNGVAD